MSENFLGVEIWLYIYQQPLGSLTIAHNRLRLSSCPGLIEILDPVA